MADGSPKDYSKIDQEDPHGLPLPRIRSAAKNQWSDGSHAVPQHRESGVDLAAVCRRLRTLPTAEIAMDSLRGHYSDVFGARKHEPPTRIKVVIDYVHDKEVYIIYVPENTAKLVRSSAPKRGNYRYFFEHTDGAYEEMMGETKVPLHQKDNGSNCIRCKVFDA